MRALLPFLLVGCATTAAGDPRPDEGPVVIELFTSQGCSSCPPADRLLSKLAEAGALGGRKIAALSFHVDYWDSLGWADPYASSAWTARQQGYAHSLGDDRVYTPELVVAGGAGMVGSQTTKVTQAIASAPHQASVPAKATWADHAVTIDATAPADADVFVAVYEASTKTAVPRGENAGETLVSDRVVRKLERVARAGKSGSVTISTERWHPGGAVVFAQRTDRRIVGATILAP
jgi:hypothetical protein